MTKKYKPSIKRNILLEWSVCKISKLLVIFNPTDSRWHWLEHSNYLFTNLSTVKSHCLLQIMTAKCFYNVALLKFIVHESLCPGLTTFAFSIITPVDFGLSSLFLSQNVCCYFTQQHVLFIKLRMLTWPATVTGGSCFHKTIVWETKSRSGKVLSTKWEILRWEEGIWGCNVWEGTPSDL